MSDNDVGCQIKHFRKLSGLTLEQLSEKMGVSTNYLLNIESGEIPSIELFIEVANILSIPPSKLRAMDVTEPTNNFPYNVKLLPLETVHVLNGVLSTLLDEITNCYTFIEQDVGSQVCKYRKSAGLSRKALAAQIGISVDQLGKIETGKKFTTLKTLFLIADKLNIPVEFILQDKCNQSALFVLKDLWANIENQLDYRQKDILFDIIDKVIYFIRLSKE